MIKKNTILKDVEITAYAAEGKCVARYNGQVIFVNGLVPGDTADLKITRKKNQFLEAAPVSVSKYSSERAEPFCQHYGICGGCKWQHLAYEHQLKYKQQQVKDSLERIAKVKFEKINPIIASDQQVYYRNKLEYTFTNSRWLLPEEINSDEQLDRRGVGFHVPKRFDRIVDIYHCHLQEEPSNKIRNFIRDFAMKNDLSFYDVANHKGLLRNLIIRSATTGENMVIVQFGENDPVNIELCMKTIDENFPAITSLNYVVNLKKNETFYDLEVVNYSGNPAIYEQLGNLKYKISPKSFFQTNTSQAQKLYDKTKELAGLTGVETVYDLYTGTGTIANYLADSSKKVIGIDSEEQAIEDARENAMLNKINNNVFLSGDAKDLFKGELFEKYGYPDVLITDPPRAGMHKDVIDIVNESAPEKIVYVSCNPATQARDLALLDEKYELKEIQPVDMFPHTHHVENIVLLKLRKS